MIDAYIDENNVKIKYPIIMKNIKTHAIVLFVSVKSGVLLSNGRKATPQGLGTLSTNWVKADDTAEWTRFNGSVKLVND